MTTSSELTFAAGSAISGIWNKTAYRIVCLLGEGANGKVYLVSGSKALFALKIGFDPMDLQMEVNAIRHLTKSYLIGVDDLLHQGRTYPFYVMKYIKGRNLQKYIHSRGPDWMCIIGQNLLRRLSELHKKGWIFGDLKVENILVSGHGDVELIDYGGVTQIGRSIRQLTEIYDRGFWNAGSRTADEKYDLFSFAVLCIQVFDVQKRLSQVKQLHPKKRNKAHLIELIESSPHCRAYIPFLHSAVDGRFQTASEALIQWKKCAGSIAAPPAGQAGGRWIKTVFIAALLVFGTTSFYLFQ